MLWISDLDLFFCSFYSTFDHYTKILLVFGDVNFLFTFTQVSSQTLAKLYAKEKVERERERESIICQSTKGSPFPSIFIHETKSIKQTHTRFKKNEKNAQHIPVQWRILSIGEHYRLETNKWLCHNILESTPLSPILNSPATLCEVSI